MTDRGHVPMSAPTGSRRSPEPDAGRMAKSKIEQLDFGVLGYLVVGLFLLAWGGSVAVWKLGLSGTVRVRTDQEPV